jgi:hypothetical protein
MAIKNRIISKDVLWKGIIHELFDEFLAFYFPDYVHLVDFSQKVIFLDKELAEISPDSHSGDKRADMLAKVFLKDGTEKWLLIHIEIQGYEDEVFELRMFQYYYRIWDKYQKPIAAIAIFTDEKEEYYPQKYELKTWNTRLIYEYHSYKVLKINKEELQKSKNPFAIVTEVVLLSIQNKKEKEEILLELKTALFRKLLEKGYPKNYIRILANFLEYYKSFHSLALNIQYKENMDKISTLLSNPYPQTMDEFILMDVERQGIKEGLEEGIERGREQGIEQGIEIAAFKVLMHVDMPIEDAAELFDLPKERILLLKEVAKTGNAEKMPHLSAIVQSKPKTRFQQLRTYFKAKWNQIFQK